MVSSREWTYRGACDELVARTWIGESLPTHVVVVAHGYGEHVGRYEAVAEALHANGAVIYATDHMGHGKSGGERVSIGTFEDVVSDLHILDEVARRENPELPVILLGHSMGGLIAARYAQRYGDTLTGLILSSPVLGSWQVVSDLLAMDSIPDAPLDPTTLSRDLSVGERYESDPLVWHGPFKERTLLALQAALDRVNAEPGVGGLPMLWIHGDSDDLVPIGGSREGVLHLRGPDYTEFVYPGARHELLNETNADEVLRDVVEFVNKCLAGMDGRN